MKFPSLLLIVLVLSFSRLPVSAALNYDYTTISDPPGTTGYLNASGISGSNIVGTFFGSYNGDISYYGYLYNGSTYMMLSVPGNTSGTYAWGVDGTNVVGQYNSSGFLYDGSNYTAINYPSATGGTWARGIDGNNIVGFYYEGNAYGYLYDGSTFTSLHVPGSTSTYAVGISGSNIVGYFTDGSQTSGFLYNNGNYTIIDYPYGSGGFTILTGVSGDNYVGYYEIDPTDIVSFIYSDGEYTVIDDPLATGPTYAMGVDGTTVVGYYQNSGLSDNTIYKATPTPEPSTWVLLGIGAGALLFFRRKKR